MKMIGTEIDDTYIAELKKQVLHQDAIDAVRERLKDRLHARFTEPEIFRHRRVLKRAWL